MPPSPTVSPRTLERDALTWLNYLMLGFYGCLLSGLGPALPGLRTDLGLSYSAAGLHGSLFAAGLIVAGLAGDRLVDRLGRRRVFWGSAFGLAGGAIVLAVGGVLAATLAGALIAGVAGSMIVVLVPAVLSDRHGRLRSSALSEANSVASGMGAIAPLLISLAIVLGLTSRIGLLFAPAIVLPLLVLAFGRVRFPTAGREFGTTEPPRQQAGLSTAYWSHWLTLVLVVSVEFCMVFWAAEYVGSVVGLPHALAATATTVFLAGMVIGRAAGGRLALRRDPASLLRAALLVAGLGFAMFWLTQIPVVAVAGLFLTGLGVAMLYPMSLGLAMAAARNAPDAAGARAALGSGIAVSFAPLILAGVADQVGLRLAYLIVVGLLVAAWLNQRRGVAAPAIEPAEEDGVSVATIG